MKTDRKNRNIRVAENIMKRSKKMFSIAFFLNSPLNTPIVFQNFSIKFQ